MTEKLRVADIPADELTPYKARCWKCARPIELWFNGGELDRATCCGLRYELVSQGTAFVVSGEGK